MLRRINCLHEEVEEVGKLYKQLRKKVEEQNSSHTLISETN